LKTSEVVKGSPWQRR